MDIGMIRSFGLALALGMLVGLQRERADAAQGGVRTFSLIALFGWVAGYISIDNGPWILPFSLLALGAMLFASNLIVIQQKSPSPGITTEVTSLLVFLSAALFPLGETTVAVLAIGVSALLLHYKDSLHEFARGLTKKDVQAIMQFVLLSVVILPLVPNKTFGPYNVINPFEIWMMVVLIVGIGLVGYVLYRWLGDNIGTIAAGILGGAVSSTATTISAARLSKISGIRSNSAALIVMLATAVALARTMIEIGVVARSRAWEIIPPIALLLLVTITISIVMYRFGKDHAATLDTPDNPSELKSAVIFGLLYALILLAVATVKEHFGTKGLYGVAFLSGLTDMDAITLSTSQMFSNDRINAQVSQQVILIAFLSNLLFKGGAVLFLGGKALKKSILIGYGILVVVGCLILLFWRG